MSVAAQPRRSSRSKRKHAELEEVLLPVAAPVPTRSKVLQAGSKITARKKPTRARKAAKITEEEDTPENVSDEIVSVLDADAEWISASATRNYTLKDPLLDWLKAFASADPRLKAKQTSEDSFTEMIMEQGCTFETEVYKLLTDRFPGQIEHLHGTSANARESEKFAETVDAMKRGVPIIYSGVLHHESTRTFGIPDLIVRSDYLGKIIDTPPLTLRQEQVNAPLLGTGKYHYVIVDVKYTTLKLTANGVHLLNSGSIPAYKTQMYIYHRALSAAQGYNGGAAFLLGRGWSYTSKDETFSGDTCFGRLGTIDFTGIKIDKEVPGLADRAVDWVREVHQHGGGWDVFKPTRLEMYPNMSNNADWPWGDVKRQIATEIADISLLWMCGPKNREIAHSHGVTRWDDPRCTLDTLGIGENAAYTRKILGCILDINRPDNPELISPTQVTIPGATTELYVDFETTSNVFDDFSIMPHKGGAASIFMIGTGYIDGETKEWVYRAFTVKEFTPEEEERVCREFTEYVAGFGVDVSLFHWSHHESSQWSNVLERHESIFESWLQADAQWVDLLKVFKEYPIVVKGALGFGLKEVVKAMHSHGMIQCSYGESSVGDGSDAMVIANRAAKEARAQGIAVNNSPSMKRIEQYNEIDCKVMMEIVRFLRTM